MARAKSTSLMILALVVLSAVSIMAVAPAGASPEAPTAPVALARADSGLVAEAIPIVPEEARIVTDCGWGGESWHYEMDRDTVLKAGMIIEIAETQVHKCKWLIIELDETQVRDCEPIEVETPELCESILFEAPEYILTDVSLVSLEPRDGARLVSADELGNVVEAPECERILVGLVSLDEHGDVVKLMPSGIEDAP